MASDAPVNQADLVKRLNRAAGHLRSVVAMCEDDRPAVDIAQQLQAVENAIASAKRALIYDNLDRCLIDVDDTPAARRALDQFRRMAKYW